MVLSIPTLLPLFSLNCPRLLPSVYCSWPSSSTSTSHSIISQMGHHHKSYCEIKTYWKGFQKVIISILQLKTGSCLSLAVNVLESSSDDCSLGCLFQDCSVLLLVEFFPIIWHKTHYFNLNKLYLLPGWSTMLFCSPLVPCSTCQRHRAHYALKAVMPYCSLLFPSIEATPVSSVISYGSVCQK